MDSDTIKLLIAILGVVSAVISVAAAYLGRRKEVLNRYEVVDNTESDAPRRGKRGARFQCPRCGEDDLLRSRGLRGTGARAVSLLLLVPGAIMALSIFMVGWFSKFTTAGGQPADAWDRIGLGCFATFFALFFLLPWFAFSRYARTRYLKCPECGSAWSYDEART